ncbi:MAG TPA: heparan-alpha-glucosaminide N-acetyltransferase domain-containing protein [Chitinophagaceae bacterium]|nr:heparan-alpha-glucosaminide N-acetyltransferase domain-containing protein [Chitinophagaceae bacterium]
MYGRNHSFTHSAICHLTFAQTVANDELQKKIVYQNLFLVKRITSIDFTRGLVMIIMAMDHIRDLMHVNSITQNPLDLTTTTPALFFTRWITHLCAPVFVFLSGTSAYLSFQKRNDIPQMRRFLVTRGIWLIILECTVVSFGIWFDIQFRILFFQVIAAIGFSFIILSFFLKSSVKTIAAVGLVIIFCHNLLDFIPNNANPTLRAIIAPLFSLVGYNITPHFTFFIGYPVLPWCGIMLLGFASGRLFQALQEKRRGFFIKAGIFILLFFIAIRYINWYGDPAPWSAQKNPTYTFLSFINVTKYPPSLLFAAVTLGCMMLILAFGESVNNRFTQIVSVYGKVPLFYYLIHWYVVHATLLVIMFIQGFHWSDLQFGAFNFGRPKAPSGLPLWGVYIVWVCVVAFMYPLCKRYSRYKLSHPEKKWLHYL